MYYFKPALHFLLTIFLTVYFQQNIDIAYIFYRLKCKYYIYPKTREARLRIGPAES